MTLYRYTDNSPADEPCLEAYTVLSETPKGFWIEYHRNPSGKKFVLREPGNNFAHQTTSQAMENYAQRKRWQIKILSRRLKYAGLALAEAERRLRGFKL